MNNPLAKRFGFASLVAFALPNIVMMLFLSLYTIIDGMFVSHYAGTTALSAINMVYPTVSVQMAVSIMIATGGSAVIARKLGAGQEEEAKQNFTFLILVEGALGLFFTVFGNVFVDALVSALGASEAQFDLCRIYAQIQFAFAPAFFLQTAFQVFFVTAGKPMLGLAATVAGGVTNIVLDYVFIVPMHMGIAGAGWGTSFGCCVPAVFGLLYFFGQRQGTLYFVRCKPDWRMLLRTCGNGSSEMVTNLANAVTTFLFNWLFLKYYGEDGVASITIILYFQFVFTAVYFGYSNGIAPVISFKYGSGDTDQLKFIFKKSVLFILACSVVSYAVSVGSIRSVLHIFTPPGSPVYRITVDGFGIYAAAFLLMGMSIFASALFTAFSDGLVSAVISFARTFVFLVGALLLLPMAIGELGVWLAVPAAEVLGIGIAIAFLVTKKKKYQY